MTNFEELAQQKRQEYDENKKRLHDEEVQKAECEKQRRAKNEQLTEELYKDYKASYQDKKLPTNHTFQIDRASCSLIHGIREDDGPAFVVFNIQHWGQETGYFQGLIPTVLVRFYNNHYTLISPKGINRIGHETIVTREELDKKVMEALAGLQPDILAVLFESIRNLMGR